MAADGVMRAPASRALVNDRAGWPVDPTDSAAEDWISLLAAADEEKRPSTRVTIVRLAPSRRTGLADYTPDELLEGFESQDPDTPPFIHVGGLTKDGKWARIPAVSHVSSRTVMTVPCQHTIGIAAPELDVFKPAEKQVERVLQGENVTFITFGQVGSGKSYTMAGPEEALGDFSNVKKTAWGIVPRALTALFKEVNDYRRHGVLVKLEASFVEVYNDTYNDLLTGEKQLKMDKKGELKKPFSREPFQDVKGLMRLYAAGSKHRVVAPVNLNPSSSRGHAVLMIYAASAVRATSHALSTWGPMPLRCS